MSSNQQPEGDRVWSVEMHGIDPIADQERHGTPFEVFWVWFAGNIGILGITFGGILATNQLNLWQSIFVALLAPALSFALVGILSIAGVWGGAPMLTLSRALFGPRGNIGPALTSWLSLVGWETVIVITASYALLGLLHIAGLPSNPFWTVVSLVVVSLIVVVLGWWGHATLIWIQRAATWIFGILTLVIVAFLIPQTDWHSVLSKGMGPWDTGLVTSFIIIMAATGIGWINAGADYTRYLPRGSSGRAITLWTIIGGTLPLFVLMIVGVLLASRKPDLATSQDPIALVGSALPAWMSVPYLITAIGGLIAAAALDIYSSGLNLLTVGIRIRRYFAVLIDGVLMVAGAIYVMLIRQDFYGPFTSFLQLLAAGLTTWAAIFLIGMISRRTYDAKSLADTTPTSAYYYAAGFNLPACLAWVIGVVVGLLFTKSTFFTGPLASGIFASTSLGYLLGALVSAVLYPLLRSVLPSRKKEVVEDKSAETTVAS
ncbi:MAG: cytosine permease [Ktedonobacteraceae bacterium]|nr:cytosine permease [Ktedonobacteraceae bacterium]